MADAVTPAPNASATQPGSSIYPYTIDPAFYVQAAQQLMMPQQMPTMPRMLPGVPKYYGPTHEALSNALQAQLMGSLSVPGLLSALQNNSTLAQQVGGLLGSYFQPNPPAVYRTDWTALPTTFTDAATAINGAPAAKPDTTQQDQARAASLLADYLSQSEGGA
jgi:hypothetical protein